MVIPLFQQSAEDYAVYSRNNDATNSTSRTEENQRAEANATDPSNDGTQNDIPQTEEEKNTHESKPSAQTVEEKVNYEPKPDQSGEKENYHSASTIFEALVHKTQGNVQNNGR